MQNIQKKMAKVQGMAVKKTGFNPHYKSKYATLDSVVELILEGTKEEKLLVMHQVKIVDGVPRVVTSVCDLESEEVLQSEFPVTGSDPQKMGGAITYGKRYNLVALFNLLTENDDDGNKASGKEAPTVSDKIMEQIASTQTVEELEKLWHQHKAKLGKEFQKAITERKNELTI